MASAAADDAGPPDVAARSFVGDMVAPPADAVSERPSDPPRTKQGVVFVNYDGADIIPGSFSADDSRTNTSFVARDYPALAGPYPAFGNGPKRDASFQAVIADWAPFDIIVTDTRPASGEYTMCMVGPANIGGPLGIAPVDCDDASTHSNVTFAFHDENDWASAAGVAVTVGQEVAHSYGLEHVADQGDIMNPSNGGGDAAFRDQCTPITGALRCQAQHVRHCAGNAQNAHQELLTLFGPAVPDTAPPTVQITYPVDGEQFEPGAAFDITADAADDTGIIRVALYINGAEQGVDAGAPFAWAVDGIPTGSYEIYALATDTASNQAMSNVVDIIVGGVGGGTAGGSAGTDDGGDDGYDPSAGGTGLPPGFGGDDDRDGCGCRSSGSTPASSAICVLLFGLARRRRRI